MAGFCDFNKVKCFVDKIQGLHVHEFVCMDCPLIILIKIFSQSKKFFSARCEELIIYTEFYRCGILHCLFWVIGYYIGFPVSLHPP